MYHHSLRQDVFIKEEYHYLNVPKVGTFIVGMTALTAPLNASAILPVCPSTWQLTKEQMESCGVSCYPQKSTAILRNIKGTRVFITFPSRWGKIFTESLLK